MKKVLLATALLCANSAWASTEWVHGEVVKLDPARGKVTLKHAPIKMVKMEAMTMPFRVKDAALLAPLQLKQEVRFEVLEQDGELVIQQIEVRP